MTMLTHAFHRLLTVVLLSLASVCAMWGTAHAADKPDQMYSQVVAAWQARDADRLSALYAKNGSSFNSPGTGQTVDANGFKAYLQAFFTAVPDFKLQVKQVDVISNDQMVDQWTVTGTWKQPFPGGPLAGAPATGKSFTLDGSSFHKMKDGKLVSTVQYFDNLSFLTQIGAVSPGK